MFRLGLSPGVRRTSVFAKGENLGARRDSFPPRKSNLEGVPGQSAGTDWGGFQRGACAPLCVVAEEGGHGGGNPIERVSPPVCVFGYFLHKQKVTRGVGPKAPLNKRCGGETPETPGVRGRRPPKRSRRGAESPASIKNHCFLGVVVSNLYPTPHTVFNAHWSETFSTFSRRRLMCTSTVRLSPK